MEDKAKVPTVLLLTQAECAPLLAPPLEAAGAAVRVLLTRADLDAAMTALAPDTRLVSFGSGVIVPADILSRLPGPAYNFHPGPPEYPGLFPSVHALYEGRTELGITLHEMAPQVDSGPIVAVNRFQILPGSDRLALDSVTFRLMLEMFSQWAERLANVATPIARQNLSWSGRRRSRADFEALCDLGEDPSPDEFARRLRAVGEGPDHALTFTRFGRRFRLVSEAAGQIVRGGVKIG
jgi:methionyl-tRNA formyltransferase